LERRESTENRKKRTNLWTNSKNKSDKRLVLILLFNYLQKVVKSLANEFKKEKYATNYGPEERPEDMQKLTEQ